MKNTRILALLLVMILLVTGCATNTSTDDTQGPESDKKTENTEVENTQETEETEDTEEVVIPEEETTMYAQEKVNVRKKPSTDSEKLGMLAKNDEVIALGDAIDGWQMIRFDDGIAYVSAEYLGLEKAKTESPETIMEVDEITAEDFEYPEIDPNKTLIVIDAGHQGKTNKEKEPNGPGSSEMKTKVASGTTGVSTGDPEYVRTLEVSLKLQEELESRGYQVIMIRTSHNINISNAQRAIVANNIGADAFIRVHCDGSDSSSAEGAVTICQTSSNPYNAEYYSVFRKLSDCVVNNYCEATGAKNRGVWETDTMTGINWCEVPTTIIELGFMTNPTEDELMATEDYQYKMAEGIANGIDEFFGK